MEHDNSPIPGKLEGHSTAPHRGAGVHLSTNRMEGKFLFHGKVDDTYPVSGCCKVSLFGFMSGLPCYMLSAAAGGLFGARQINIPSIGTEVLVYVPQDRKFGYILGYIPTTGRAPLVPPAGQIVMEGGVSGYSEKEPFFHGDWKSGRGLPPAGGGSTVDALPGDEGVINDFGCFIGMLRNHVLFRGSELAKIEAYSWDDLLCLTAHNLTTFSAQGERRIFEDCGRISEEEQIAATLGESLGSESENVDAFTEDSGSLRTAPDRSLIQDLTERQVGRWRWKSWRGWLGDFAQSFLCRPANGSGSLNKADRPDMGLYQEALTLSGQHLERSIIGGGIHKTLQVAVPKKKRESDDPAGDQVIERLEPKKDFAFDPKHPMGFGAQARDYFAYVFNVLLPSRRGLLKKDWEMPDEATCPAPGAAPAVPGIDGFFREFPEESEIMEAKDGVGDDTTIESKKFRVGEAFCGILPDGSFLARNAWGDTMEMRAGHINFSSSNGVTTTSGGSIVHLAGDDFIAKARKAIDLTATEEQVRIKGERDVLVHSEKGGVGITAPHPGAVDTKSHGEKTSLTGIVLKSSDGVVLNSNQITLSASGFVQVKESPDHPTTYPNLLIRCGNQLQDVRNGTIIYKLNDDYVALSDGNVLATKNVIVDQSVQARESVNYGRASGKFDPSKSSPIKGGLSNYITDKTFPSAPYTDDQLKSLIFTYRSTEDYATIDGRWYEAPWQRDLAPDLEAWKEKEIEGTYPWPGERHYSGGESFFTYKEVNVEKSGKPKARQVQAHLPGAFSGSTFGSLKVLPNR